MDKIDFIAKNMKYIPLESVPKFKNTPILMVSPRIIKATKDNQTVEVFDAGYDYEWFVFNGNIPCEDSNTTRYFVLKDWQ